MAQPSTNPYADANDDPYDYDYQPFGNNRNNASVNYSGTDAGTFVNAGQPSGVAVGDEDPRSKLMDLQRREAELERREREMLVKEATTGSEVYQKPNWPRCYPIVYHSILGIPSRLRKIVAIMGYIGWFVLALCLVINLIFAFVTCLPFVVNATDSANNIQGNFSRVQYVFMAFAYCVIGIPAHFVLSYWSLYKAMQTVHILRFCVFFVTYALPILFCGFCITGFYEYGAGGLILMISYFPWGSGGDTTGFVLQTILTFMWMFLTFYFVLVYALAIIVFRKENHTFKKARELAQSSIVSGVTNAVTSGIQNVAAKAVAGALQPKDASTPAQTA